MSQQPADHEYSTAYTIQQKEVP